MLDFVAHPLVEPSWLEAHLTEGDVRVVDARGLADGTSREMPTWTGSVTWAGRMSEEWGTCSCRPNRSRRSWKRSGSVTDRAGSPTPKRNTTGRLGSGGRC